MLGWGFDSTVKNINDVCEVYMNEKKNWFRETSMFRIRIEKGAAHDYSTLPLNSRIRSLRPE